MFRHFFLVVLLTLVYIYLVTVIFEYFINKPSSTLLSLSGILLFAGLSFIYAYFLFKQYKNHLK